MPIYRLLTFSNRIHLSVYLFPMALMVYSPAYPRSSLSEVDSQRGVFLQLTEAGFPNAPNAVFHAIYGVMNAVNWIQASVVTGPLLELAIVRSRNDAIEGAAPIPPSIRRQLTGYATEASMKIVRYKIGNVGSFNVAHLIERGGFADAVTLIDVVVFRDANSARNVCAWAHELRHVDQFTKWGAQGFAIRYILNWHSVETEAYARGEGYPAWKRRKLHSQLPQTTKSACWSEGEE